MKNLAPLLILFSNYVAADQDYSISGVEIGMTLSEVIAIKGPPDKENEILDWFDRVYSFKELKVYSLGSQLVVGLESTNVNDCTHHNICPKENVAKAIKILGSASNVLKTGNGSLHIFAQPGTGCSYQFRVNNETIESVNVICSPD